MIFQQAASQSLGQSQEPEQELTPVLCARATAVKKRLVAMNRGLRSATKAIRDAHALFKTQAAPLIASLTAMKRDAIDAVKLTDGYREGVRTQRSAHALLNKLRHDYTLSPTDELALGLANQNRHRWLETATCVLRHTFRIRL